MKISSKKREILAAMAIAFAFVGCGGPSKDDVCAPCEGDADAVTSCEESYDLCKDTSGCKTKDLEEVWELACGSF